MELFKTYKLWDIEPVRGLDTTLWDKDGVEYTDLYGGHAVISIGHSHPHYVKMLSDQLAKLGFYSNAVQNSLQKELARRLGKASGLLAFSVQQRGRGQRECHETGFFPYREKQDPGIRKVLPWKDIRCSGRYGQPETAFPF